MSGMNKKDFETQQEVRWCPGCGDYAILAAMQKMLASTHQDPDQVVFVSGIGCSSRFPYYMNTYGFHTLHGRAPCVATGLKLMRPELSVWVITGDGDGLSIGANHLVHLLRRNVPLKVLLFNNRIYGLTKGQYSPTSPEGTTSKSSPAGSWEHPLDPCSLALAAGATFVARGIDVDSQLPAVLQAAQEHPGAAFVEIIQNCPVFNDNAFVAVRDKAARASHVLPLVHGQKMCWGQDNQQGVRVKPWVWEACDPLHASVHDQNNRAQAQMLLVGEQAGDVPFWTGVLYQEQRATPPQAPERKRDVLQVLLQEGQAWQVAEASSP